MAWNYWKAVQSYPACSDSETGFTGMVYLDGDTDVAAHANADGSDLRISLDGGVSWATQQKAYFYKSGGAAYSLIYFNYDPTTSAPTPRLYYGNSSASNTDSSAVWDSNTVLAFSPVNPTASYTGLSYEAWDLSPQGNSLTSNINIFGGSIGLSGGLIGPAVQLNGAYLATTLASFFGESTVTFWLNAESNANYIGFLYGRGDWLGDGDFLYRLTGQYFELTGDATGRYANGPIDCALDSNWHQLSGIYSNSPSRQISLSLDGSTAGPFTGISSDPTATNIRVGYDVYYNWNGLINRLTISQAARSQDWLNLDRAIVNGWANSTLTLGPQQSTTSPAVAGLCGINRGLINYSPSLIRSAL